MLSNLKQHLNDFYFKSDSYTDQLICKLFGSFPIQLHVRFSKYRHYSVFYLHEVYGSENVNFL